MTFRIRPLSDIVSEPVYPFLDGVEVPETYNHWFSDRDLPSQFSYSSSHFEAQFVELYTFVSEYCITPFSLTPAALEFVKQVFLSCFFFFGDEKPDFDLSSTPRYRYDQPSRCWMIRKNLPEYASLLEHNVFFMYINSVISSLLHVHYCYLRNTKLNYHSNVSNF